MWLTPPSPCSTPSLKVQRPSCSESPATTFFSVAVSSSYDLGLSGATFQSLKDFASRMVTQPPLCARTGAAAAQSMTTAAHPYRITRFIGSLQLNGDAGRQCRLDDP